MDIFPCISILRLKFKKHFMLFYHEPSKLMHFHVLYFISSPKRHTSGSKVVQELKNLSQNPLKVIEPGFKPRSLDFNSRVFPTIAKNCPNDEIYPQVVELQLKNYPT
jgi:hypothetical protein